MVAPQRDAADPLQADRRRSIFHLVFAVPCLLVIVRWLLPLTMPGSAKVVIAILLLAASQYHFWSRLSSGSVFAPEFPREVVIAFNWAFGTMVLLAVLQLVLDVGTLVLRGGAGVPDAVRYTIAGVAGTLAAIGVANAFACRRSATWWSRCAACRPRSTDIACCN